MDRTGSMNNRHSWIRVQIHEEISYYPIGEL